MRPEDFNRELGRRLRRQRLAAGLTLAGVAAKCGVSLQQLQRYETGENVISAYMLCAIAHCLAFDAAGLLPEWVSDEDGSADRR